MSEKYAWEGKGLDEVAARELYLFIDSDSDLYRQQREPIIKNLVAKKARGVYNPALAIVAFGYLAESGAKKYYGERGRGWSQVFPKKLRDAVAEELRDSFETEYGYGNYDNLIPKKYQKKVVYSVSGKPKPKRRAGSTTTLSGMR